jgi:two-component system, NarL family, nitrate/nitrite response regulator NarL
MTIRIVIADDHPVVLEGLAKLFGGERDFEVVARAMNGDEALRAVSTLAPDVLVLDLRMPGKDGMAVLAEMRRELFATRIVLLTALNSKDVQVAIRLGVDGVVLKDMALGLLVECVRSVHAGRRWIDKVAAHPTLNATSDREPGTRTTKSLTRRELQIARMVAEGLPSKHVAGTLAITEGTAKLHLHHIYSKLNLRGRVALMRYAQRNGFD